LDISYSIGEDINRVIFIELVIYKCKEKFIILKSIGIIVIKTSQSSTPADIPADV